MTPLTPVGPLFAQAGSPQAAYNPTPSSASVAAFQTALANPLSPSMQAEWFGNATIDPYHTAAPSAPVIELPEGLSYLRGTTAALEKILPAVSHGLPSPTELLAAQLQISSIQLGWQFISKATGTAVQGVQSLVNSQV